MKTAFLFAGQGSQHRGMGRDFYERYEGFREIFDLLSAEQKIIAFEGPEEALAETINTQPIMVAFAAGVNRLLKDGGIKAEAAAGLSLGEYSALCAAGVFTEKQAIELVSYRAKVMAEAAKGVDCRMLAVLGLDRQTVLSCCEEGSAMGIVQIANYNCPGQMVIAGSSAAVEKAGKTALERGAKRCLPLKVSGPFHTVFMESAGKKLEHKLAEESFGKMKFPVYHNCLGTAESSGELKIDMLVRQISGSVYFEDTIRNMTKSGIARIIEIGPGKTLAGFVKKTEPRISVMSIDTLEDFERVLETMGGR